MGQTVDDLTIAFKEGDVETVKELGKVILTKGAWCTVLFRFQSWDARKQVYGPVQYGIRRYQKRGDVYMQRSKFNISSNDQAHKIIDALSKWMAETDTTE